MPIECTIKPGEMLYFPTWWLHAVLNLGADACVILRNAQRMLCLAVAGQVHIYNERMHDAIHFVVGDSQQMPSHRLCRRSNESIACTDSEVRK